MTYVPAEDRYDHMPYRRCGRSGLKLPAISLGLWQNFGDDRPIDTQRAILRRAFDLGITHFDLANNYGPPYGSAEINFGRLLAEDLRPWRDELVISTKAGYDMWPGPYGEWGSRKYLLASLDQSLQRMGLDYVDIFYSHRLDPDTPLEETLGRRRHRGAPGQGALRGHLLVLGPAHRGGHRDPARPRHAAAHPPALLLAAEPLDRARPARRPRPRGRRRHRLLAARAGHAHRPLPRRHPRGLARRPRRLAVEVDAQRREPRARPRAQRDRAAPRADAGPARAGLDAARPARDLDPDRRQQRRAARGQRRRARRAWTSTTTSWPRSSSTRSTPGSTSGSGRARLERWSRRGAFAALRRRSTASPREGSAAGVGARARTAPDGVAVSGPNPEQFGTSPALPPPTPAPSMRE